MDLTQAIFTRTALHGNLIAADCDLFKRTMTLLMKRTQRIINRCQRNSYFNRNKFNINV